MALREKSSSRLHMEDVEDGALLHIVIDFRALSGKRRSEPRLAASLMVEPISHERDKGLELLLVSTIRYSRLPQGWRKDTDPECKSWSG